MIYSRPNTRFLLNHLLAARPVRQLGSRSSLLQRSANAVNRMTRGFAAAPPHGAHNASAQAQKFDAFKIERQGHQTSERSKQQLIRYHETREELMSRKDDFNQWSVHISNKSNLKAKIQAIQNDGSSNLMILADFDQTISSFYVPDKLKEFRNQRLTQVHGIDEASMAKDDGPINAEATIKVMLECDRITQDGIDETRQLFKKYRPIEIDPNLSVEEKQRHMADWWTENLKLFSSLHLTDSDFRSMVSKSKMACRHGIVELLEQVRVNDMPFVVVSGGVKEVIDVIFYEIIREQLMNSHHSYDLKEYEHLQQLYNLKVLSNTFHYKNIYNPMSRQIERIVTDYDRRLLHSMNKYEFVNEVSKDVMQPLLRKNVIVMGDQLHDIKVVEPSLYENVLSIGYLNDKKNEHQLQSFLDTFDLVICRDGPLLPLNMILDTLTCNTASADQQVKLQAYAEFPQMKELCDLLLSNQQN